MTKALKRGLFGYRPGSVRSILADREQMFERATRDVQLAKSRGDELATELESARGELESALTELEAAQTGRDAVEADLETVRSERDAANAERDTLLAELVTARTERDSARSELAERERLLDEATARSARLESEAEGARTLERQEGERARKAIAELALARRDLAASNAGIRELERVIERLEAERAPEAGADSATPQITNSGDLDRVLQETESTINRIVGEARRGAERELAEIEGRRDEVRAEVEALIAQRDRLAPLAENVRELLGEAQARTQDADTRIRTVLEPLAATVGALRGRLAELMDEAEREDEIEIVASEEEEPAGSEDAPSALIHLADGPRISRSPW